LTASITLVHDEMPTLVMLVEPEAALDAHIPDR